MRISVIGIIFSIMVLTTVACSTLGYYSQAIGGQLRLMHAREPIRKLLAAEDTDPNLKAQLAEILEMRRFASSVLLLPNNKSYTAYAETGKPALVWNVVATEPFSLQARNWCFPVAGCVPYRGYFKRENAERFARRLRRQGLDVAVSGATAYSTLGYFADPVLDTMLDYPDYQLAGLIFHELAHQHLYLKGDADFNESFATAVERIGVGRWLQATGSGSQRERWLSERARARDFSELLISTRNALEALYHQPLDREQMRIRKADIFRNLQNRYQKLKASRWSGYDGYDNWFQRDLNNAHLALFATYEGGTQAFLTLYREHDNNLPAFYAAVEAISRQGPEQRRQWMNSP